METLSRRNKKANPRSRVSLLSRITFWYLNPLFRKGSKARIEVSDIHATLREYSSEKLGKEIEREWEREVKSKSQDGKTSLLNVLIRAHKATLIKVGLITFLLECLHLISPYMVGYVVDYFAPSNTISKRDAFLYAGACALSLIFATMLHHYVFFSLECLGLKQRTALTSLIYQKATRLSQVTFSKTSAGQIVNFVSSDAQKMLLALLFSNHLWIAPFQLIAVTVLLYNLIGVSAFPGTAVMLFMAFYQVGLGKLFAYLRNKIGSMTDKRVKIMGEVIKGMRAIKMYSWEEPFAAIVKGIRRKEIKRIHQSARIKAFNLTTSTTMPYVCGLVMFTTHYMLGETLTASKVFTSLALLQAARLCMAEFLPLAVELLSEAYVSCMRIQKFLELDECSGTGLISKPLSTDDLEPYVVVENASASWDLQTDNLILDNLCFDVSGKNSLFMIVGPVGAGKSSILMLLSGELPLMSGHIKMNGSISCVPQQPWIFSGTIKQNILFGLPYDAEKYDKVVNACALIEDFLQLPDSDLSIVGDRGVTLSGGQKARISLARAVYRDADIYLFDDPLSAVDTKVGRHIFEHCMNGILKDKIRILCTHQTQYLTFADQILTIRDGKQINVGSLDQLNQMMFDIESLVSEGSTIDKEWDKDSAIDFEEIKVGAKKQRVRTGSSVSANSRQLKDSKVSSKNNLSYASDEPVCASKESVYKNNDDEETIMEGHVSVGIYVKYFRAGGGIFISLMVFLIAIISRLCLTGADWWLGVWSSVEEAKADNTTVVNYKYYFNDNRMNNLYMFVGVTLFSVAISMCSSFSFFWLAVNSSKNLHHKMLQALLKTTMYFFDSTPLGRILNRFSKDTYFLDEELPWAFHDIVQFGFFSINAIVVSVVNVPYILIILAPLAVAFLALRSYYLQTARDVKRLEGTCRSPMFSHLSATLDGLTTIRSSNSVEKVTEEFYECQDHQSEAWYLFICIIRWFALRLEALLLIFVTISIFGPFIIKEFSDVNSTLVGLTLLYCLQLGGLFQFCVRQSAEVESLMTSTERIMEYCNLDPEPEPESDADLTRGWPKYGIITAEGASFAHHKSLPYVLKTMFFCIRASEKVGVIGRTGAGKSSLISAMFRTGKLMGTIRIDGAATSEISLKTLRSSMSVIPQDPVLFSGPLRLNIDPLNEFEDPDIWEVLEEVLLKDVVFDLPNKLNTEVSEGGSNFSVGQRQLLCLARALLLRKKILFIDEATANVDNDTDALIQETIKDKFRDCTVVTIAHRLNTVMDYDRIMVLKAGKIVQFDEPCELFKDKNGEFVQLVEQAGPVEAARLEMLAKEAKELRQLIRERTQQTYPGFNVARSKTREEIMEIFGSRVVYETTL